MELICQPHRDRFMARCGVHVSLDALFLPGYILPISLLLWKRPASTQYPRSKTSTSIPQSSTHHSLNEFPSFFYTLSLLPFALIFPSYMILITIYSCDQVNMKKAHSYTPPGVTNTRRFYKTTENL